MTRREKIDDVIRTGGFLSGNQSVHDIADLRAFVPALNIQFLFFDDQ